MNLIAWRGNKQLASWLKSVLESANGQELLRMLEEIHIRHFHVLGMDPAEALGRSRGYDVALNNLTAAAEYTKPPKEVPATYEKPPEGE